VNTDKFPEAFRRFERVVDTRWIRSFDELRMSFESWQGYRSSSMQRHALAREAMRIGIPVDVGVGLWKRKVALESDLTPTWRHEFVIIRNRSFARYRDLRTGRFIRKP
jgi:hypothetical protein